MRGQALRTSGPATMKPSALRIERLPTKVEAELAFSARTRRYVFHFDEIAAAEAQGLPYVLVPRVLSNREWMEKYGGQPVAEAIPGSAPAADTTKKSAPQNDRERA
jgi:Rps23 Pro-64 3,4-dihydroxylase Tpa1-like proline 4-hydroxylase